mgnify:FL=1
MLAFLQWVEKFIIIDPESFAQKFDNLFKSRTRHLFQYFVCYMPTDVFLVVKLWSYPLSVCFLCAVLIWLKFNICLLSFLLRFFIAIWRFSVSRLRLLVFRRFIMIVALWFFGMLLNRSLKEVDEILISIRVNFVLKLKIERFQKRFLKKKVQFCLCWILRVHGLFIYDWILLLTVQL